MEKNGLCILGLYACFAALLLVQHCDATKTINGFRNSINGFRNSNTKSPPTRKIHFFKKLYTNMQLDSSNTEPFVSPPFSMAPYDSLPPVSLPQNAPPFCVDPPSINIPTPTGYTPLPPPASSEPVLPGPNPVSPSSPYPPATTPSPPTNVPTPVLSPPYYEPAPPTGSVPSPRFLPPVVYPPPTVPPPPNRVPSTSLWCVAKASVPDPIIQEAMNYACGSGADCDQLQPSGSCFEPNTLFAHASYAFNSYWQRTKVTGGTCDFGGTAVLVTVDPSYDGCQFIYF